MPLFLSLDFETTGLDTKKDDPIQIGLVIFDETGTIHASYSSLIKPQKSEKELKEIVQYITGFDSTTLQYAPTQQEVFTALQEYLSKDLILIGHNVSFDLAIIKRFLPKRSPKITIDTFDCARQLLHFQQSYALDALVHLDQQQQLGIFENITGNAHNALYDATASMQLFLRWYNQAKKLASKYPLLKSLGAKNEITKMLFQQSGILNFASGIVSLPPLQSHSFTNTKIISQQQIAKSQQPTANSHQLSEIIKGLFNPKSEIGNPLILSVNHPSKISILKLLLQQQGITAHDSVHDLPKLNAENAYKFIQKLEFSRSEIGFLLKYFSQLEKGHSLIDCKSVDDYKILNAITDLSSSKLQPITLCTHQHLRSFAHKIEPQTQIYFFDHDHRLTSYLHNVQQPIDLLHLINLVDQLSYRYALEGNEKLKMVCETFMIQLCIFSARFHNHIGKYLSNRNVTTMDCLGLADDTLDPYTRRLLMEIKNYLEPYQEQIALLHQGQLCITQRERCVAILAEPFVIEKKTLNENRYAVFHAPAYHVTYEDFLESLPKAEYTRIKSKVESIKTKGSLGHRERNEVEHGDPFFDDGLLHTSQGPKSDGQSISQLNQNFQLLSTILNKNKNLFLLSQSKSHSKGLFDWMIKQKQDQHYTILAENITGGTGKALLFAKKSKKTILFIGSENYYYTAIGSGLSFDHIGLWYYKGEHIDLLKADLTFYTI